MSRSNGKLQTEDLELLDMLGAASTDDSDAVAFAYVPLGDWPFAWLVHPGLVGEARVIDRDSFSRLEETGCVVFTIDEGEPPCRHAMLTYNGMTCYRKRQERTGRNQPYEGQDAAGP